jgi:acetylornithine deacetylase
MDLLADLVSIDSVNPALVPGAAGEREIAGFVAEWLRARGLEVSLLGPEARPSVVGVARGRGGGQSLMLCAHTDTVSVAGMASPHEPRIEDGRLYGRGSFDMKGGLAAIMQAAAAAAALDLRGDVIVAAVSDEEYASDGVQDVLGDWSADACIVTEPTDLRACIAHKGFIWAEIETHGVAAHGSRVDLGVDAIAGMGPVLAGIPALQERLNARPHPLLGPGSLHASLISGGVELSSYPDSCVLSVERRTVPGETAASVEAELRELLALAPVGGEVRMGLVREPFSVDPGAPIVTTLLDAAAGVLGAAPAVYAETPWMDSAFTSAAGIPTVVFGASGEGAHALEEYADLASLDALVEVLIATVGRFCS